MLQQVVLNLDTPVTFDIDAVDPDEILIIKSISGLDPADVTLFTGDYSRDGGYYQGRRSSGRNPVITFKINPDYAGDIEVSDIREMLYAWFFEPSHDNDGVQVILKDDRKPDRYFIGYTEKLPSGIFESDPTAQVSMVCVDPYLLSVDETTNSNAGWSSVPVDYEGVAKTGLVLEVTINTACTEVNIDIGGVVMTLEGTFAVDDVLDISTVLGNRYIKQNGTDIMVALTAASRWPYFSRGTNTIKVYGDTESDGKAVLTSYTYRGAWWGI